MRRHLRRLMPSNPTTIVHSSLQRSCFTFLTTVLTRTRLLRILFAATCGIQFIRSTLLGSNEHPAKVELLNEASDRSLEAFCTPEEIAAARIPAQTRIVRPNPGDCLRYVDRNNVMFTFLCLSTDLIEILWICIPMIARISTSNIGSQHWKMIG
ncbi:hypothetical protein M413DRAFT_234554 [Hebeloma cylindrosporum]|uniref:Uncharacterized protein n=1 Tax=Hebeloma cylindrosporum TaxID=76867 RepID=A0A0C3C400_HEBCY|nr:hypothetical protein M413DRAFT_234554 [Hebeloma cylindrosporum h7]